MVTGGKGGGEAAASVVFVPPTGIGLQQDDSKIMAMEI